jgi:hypothetical protein
LTVLGIFDRINQRNSHLIREPLRMSGLKEGAAGAVGE